jgi:hypothetical protein
LGLAPGIASAVRLAMTPDHEFGTPQVDVHKRTTKVNFSVVGAVIIFLAIGAAALFWFWRQS